jgi:regulatory protein
LRILKIQRLRGKRQRYRVQFDDAPDLELSDWTLGKHALRTGDELDEKFLETIRTTETTIQAKNIAINFLSYRPRSTKEVSDHLVKKGFVRVFAREVAEQLQSVHLIDDLQFARMYVRDRLQRKPTGQALLRLQLSAKGISPAMADQVLGELISEKDQQAGAVQAAKKKNRLLHHGRTKMEEEKRKKRLLDFLLRRGFSFDIALKAVRITLEQ